MPYFVLTKEKVLKICFKTYFSNIILFTEITSNLSNR